MQSQQPQRQIPGSSQQQDESVRPHQSPGRSTTCLDSETLLLDDTNLSEATAETTDPLQEQASSQAPYQPSISREDDEPRKCWICFSDETEDTPDSGAWRSPCPCALSAHEKCLLDWIADLEAPDRSRSTPGPAEIHCPQCKSQIHLARPRSFVVEAVSSFEKHATKALLPAFVGGLSYLLILGASQHGANSIRLIFGNTDAEAILAPIEELSQFEQLLVKYIPSIAAPIVKRWRGMRVELGLPLIPVALVASRTTLADAVLPILPIVFFATHPKASQTLSTNYWPPSAALSFVVLPYIRTAYDEYMEHVWGEKERGWLKEIKPTLGGQETEGQGGDQDDEAFEEGEDIFELEIGIEARIGGDQEVELAREDAQRQEEEQPQQQVAEGHQEQPRAPAFDDPPFDDPPHDGEEGEYEQDRVAEEAEQRARVEAIANGLEAAAAQRQQRDQRQDQQNPQPQPNVQQPAPRRHAIDIITTAAAAGSTVAGALLFPTVSAASGELLRLLLPLSWTQAGQRAPTGILQTRWGRSVVGGCLFVVLKDAVRIYCRWRTAVSFRDRHVRDFDKKKGKLVA